VDDINGGNQNESIKKRVNREEAETKRKIRNRNRRRGRNKEGFIAGEKAANMTELTAQELQAYETMRLLQVILMTRKSGLERWAYILACCTQLIMEPMRGGRRDIVETYVDISLEEIKKIIFENLEKWDVKP